MAVVRLDGVSKRYDGGGQLAVDNVSFEVRDGEFMVLLGPSGCGKSTTLRMIAGLEAITEGAMSIDGAVMNRIPAKDRDIAMVFQSYALYPHMTVKDNLAFGLRRRGLPRDEIERRVAEAAATLGLSELLARRPYQLSGGQRQRVALGRAIVRNPKVFLFDEPLSNLDAALRVSMRSELIRLHRRLGATIIYVTHDQVEAMTMGSRICIMNQARMVQLGPPLEVYRNPANTFVAGFLGNPPMNLVPAALDGADGLALRVGHATVPLPADRFAPLAVQAGRPVVFGIRPEDIYEENGAAGRNGAAAVEAEVAAVETLGAETLLILTLPGVSQDLTARMGRDSRARVGDRIGVRLDVSAAHLFDPDTGWAIDAAAGRA